MDSREHVDIIYDFMVEDPQDPAEKPQYEDWGMFEAVGLVWIDLDDEEPEERLREID